MGSNFLPLNYYCTKTSLPLSEAKFLPLRGGRASERPNEDEPGKLAGFPASGSQSQPLTAHTARGDVTQNVQLPSSPATGTHAVGPDWAANAAADRDRGRRICKSCSGRRQLWTLLVLRGSLWRSRGWSRTASHAPSRRWRAIGSLAPPSQPRPCAGGLRVRHLAYRK